MKDRIEDGQMTEMIAELPPVVQSNLFAFKKTKFAAEIEAGEDFVDVFLLEDVRESKKKNGESYWTLTLRDRTGTILGKVWKKPDAMPVKGTFVKVQASSSEFRDQVELKIDKIRPVDPAAEAVATEDFVPVGPLDRFALIEEMAGFATVTINHPGIRAACLHVLTDSEYAMDFRDAPAAAKIHQPYVGGLVEHALSMFRVAQGLWQHYGDAKLDADLLFAACILHDVGKIRELQWATHIGYTVEGQVIGHVAIGMEILDKLKPIFVAGCGEFKSPEEYDAAQAKWLHLRHIVASHHGQLEWRAIVTPMSREAQLFHLVDMIDSSMAAFDEINKLPTDAEGFGPWNRKLEGPSWKPQS